ncbi:MAG: YggS family pyridoxal phosphate-dependent enzyme [Bacteroidales bacterium]|nr:YggS family pyridoxal phosphate-dependent enzyme [Bacteroidales bacterium]
MIAENIAKIKAELPEGVSLIAVSKLKPAEDILEAYNAGQRLFGENYATELRDKAAVLPKDIEWQFIGHLQGKQLKYYIPFVSMIHGVDSVEHLQEVEKAAAKVERVVDVLLQVHVAQEETKFGFAPEDLDEPHELAQLELPHVRVRGLMGMASHTDDKTRVRDDFRRVKSFFDSLKTAAFNDKPWFDTVSMGMSHDWQIAVEEGSTMVRLGTSIFGARDYTVKR